MSPRKGGNSGGGKNAPKPQAPKPPKDPKSGKPIPKMCRTPEEAFAAGWDDGANDPPLTDEQIARLVVLHAPYLRPKDVAA